MKLEEIKIGEIFTIGETPSYPKLRTEMGWIDMRDKIVMIQEFAPDDCRLIMAMEMRDRFKLTSSEIEEWKKEVLANAAIEDEFC